MQDTNKWVLHHKVIIIDGKTVITGSFNFSKNASKTNDENLLIIDGNTAIAQLYTEEFQRVSGKMKLPTPSRIASKPVRAKPAKLNINMMTKAEIEGLPGVGTKLAERIIEGRPYRSMADLQRVQGLGPQKLGVIKDKVAFK